MPEAVWEASSYDNKTYFIPIYKESAEGCDLIVPQRLIDAHNFGIFKIKELKDIEPMLADCKADGLKYPLLTQGMDFFFTFITLTNMTFSPKTVSGLLTVQLILS